MVMTTLRAAGERLRPFTDTVFVAQRPKVLNMSGVRQCLEDRFQLQIQRVSARRQESSRAQLE